MIQGAVWMACGAHAGIEARLKFTDGGKDSTNGNAFKHAYWNALMIRSCIGPDGAKL